MRHVWDPAKDAVNRRKHGLPLSAGVPALMDPSRYFWRDDRFEYDEDRWITLGMNGPSILVVVSVERERTGKDEEEIVRIISVRKAVGIENDWYYLGRT